MKGMGDLPQAEKTQSIARPLFEMAGALERLQRRGERLIMIYFIVVFPFLLFAFVRFAVQWAGSWHWSLGVVASIAMSGALLYLGRQIDYGVFAGCPRWVSISAPMSKLTLIIVTFATISNALFVGGYVRYSIPAVDVEGFVNLYCWHFIDMLPAIDVWKTIGSEEVPVKPANGFAGTLLIGFRVITLVVLFQGFRGWWLSLGSGNSTGQEAPREVQIADS
jgi:hypothetical protein